MIRKKKLFVRPKKLYQKGRISEENALMEKYALKNKKEIWKTLAKVNYFRSRAKILAKESDEEQKILFSKLSRLGLNVKGIADVLALKIDDILNRRLTSVIYNKKLSATPQQARQLVAHKKVSINSKIINIPGYLVSVDEESLISVILPPKRAAEPEESVSEEPVASEEGKK